MRHLYLNLFISLLYVLSLKAQATFFKEISTSNETNQIISPGVEFNGFYYFNAGASTILSRSTMWKTNGTSNGTTDFIDSEDISSVDAIFVFNNELYYNINEIGVKKVYKTNGTTSTLFLESSAEAPEVFFDNRSLAILNTDFIFSYGNTTTGYEIYISDGTPTNTPTLLKDIRPGSNSSSPIYFTKIADDKVVFRADDGINGRELWITDGTTSGTKLLKDINPSGNASIIGLTSFNGKAYFQSGNDIWETDGTEIGTKIFLNLRLNDNSEYPFHVYKDNMYFTAYDATFNKVDLWKTDGTVAGSTILASNLNYADVFKGTNTLLFFAAEDDAHGYELWRTDGTVNGTYLTRDINPGPEGSLVSEPSLGNGGNKLFFEAIYYDEDGNTDPNLSNELWSSDGTGVGTLLNTSINSSSFSSVQGSSPDYFFNINGKLLFQADVDSSGFRQNRGINLWIVNANLLSVEENKKSNHNFQLYPNPSSDFITVEDKNNSIEEIDIYALTGRKIKTITSNFQSIPVQELSTGTYIISIKLNEGTRENIKFLKK
jgi:ELWxxDGT repeat protein